MAGTVDRAQVNPSENHYLRRYVACRDAGDAVGAAEAWSLLMHHSYDRVAGFVRVAGARGNRLRTESEFDEATQQAIVRLWRRMSETFEGTSMGEYVMATKQLCEYAVLDVQRAAAIRAKHVAGSIDDTFETDEGEQLSRFNDTLRAEAERRGELAENALEAQALIATYLPRLAKERSRTVLEDMRDGVPLADTAAKLGVTHDNAYQLRSRALKEMRKLIEEDQA